MRHVSSASHHNGDACLPLRNDEDSTDYVPRSYYGHTVRKMGNMVVIVATPDGHEVNLGETPMDY